ncbi:MAG TPA: BamA/TamA family outer membrane protein [Polyangiaceae bacterium]
MRFTVELAPTQSAKRFAVACFAACSGVFLSAACAKVPQNRAALDRVEFVGNQQLGDNELKKSIASSESPRFLGLFKGVVYDYTVFDRYVLERDLERIERHYRAKGFYRARVRAARVTYSGRQVRVQLVVEEGPPVIVKRVDVHGLEALPPELATEASSIIASQMALGDRFEEEHFLQTETALRKLLTDHGYAYAATRRSAGVDIPTNVASVGYWVTPGPVARFGEVRIEGLGSIPEAPVRRALDITTGGPYSTAELDSARQALLELGVFSSVEIEPELTSPAPQTRDPQVPIRVRVEPSKLRSVHVGGGVQIDTLRTDVHLLGGWESRNFFGGLRSFSVELTPGVVLYPTRLPTFQAPKRLLPEVKLRSELRQPGFIEARTGGLLRAEGSIFPVLLSTKPDLAAPILGYREVKGGPGVDRSFGKVYASLSHNAQLNSPFTYFGALDPDLRLIVISYPELFGTFDLRDGRVHPHSGVYLSARLQAAGVGGDARDVKLQPEFRGYVPLGPDVTLAMRTTVGLLYPDNYGDTVETNALTGTAGGATRAHWIRDVQLMFLRGFFSGGSGSNRGYAEREIGPHGAVPFYNPGQTTSFDCTAGAPGASQTACDLPLGGFTLWEASIEFRYPIEGPFSGAIFSDASDVSPRRSQFRWDHPHLSVGLGVRYDTPVGPIRADAGYRIPGLQAPDTPDERRPGKLFGAPMAASFGIGESF